VNIDHHHRRIHWKTRLIRWGMIPLAALAAPAWLYVSYGTCQEEGDDIGTLCHAFRVIPFLPTAAALALIVFIVWDLMKAGHAATGRKTAKPRLHHAAHGYRAISHRHRRHIHWALLTVCAVTLALALGIGWEAYQSTH
jgi:biotin transporter BioY